MVTATTPSSIEVVCESGKVMLRRYASLAQRARRPDVLNVLAPGDFWLVRARQHWSCCQLVVALTSDYWDWLAEK